MFLTNSKSSDKIRSMIVRKKPGILNALFVSR